MSSCSRRYASKSIPGLTHLNLQTSSSVPLWFLYPKWLRADLSRRNYSDLAHGQGRRCSGRRKEKLSRSAALVLNATYAKCQDYRSIRQLHQHSSHPAKHSPGKALLHDEVDFGVERNVLDHQRIVRKVVPSSRWSPKQEHIPELQALERRLHYNRIPNPNALLALLRSFPNETPKKDEAVLRLALPEAVQHELVAPGVTTNTWQHHDGSGCAVKYEAGWIELSGTPRAQELARKFFSEPQNHTRSQKHLDWFRKAVHGSHRSVQDIARPPSWTMRSLTDYMWLITRPQSRRSAQRGLYWNNGSHNRAVFDILLDIFTHPESSKFLSTFGLRLALRFCREHTEFPSTGSQLWNAFVATGLKPDVGCFNEELGRCLVSKDFHRFCERIEEMKRLDIRPIARTWAVITSWAQRRSTCYAILRLAIAAPGPHASLVVATAKKEILHYPGTQDGIRNFMTQMEDHFGADWLTSRVLSRILHSIRVGRVGRAGVAQASQLLVALRESGKQGLVDQDCVMELIWLSRKAGNFDEAIELVKHEALSQTGAIPEEAIKILFLMAWRRRCFNICRFFWFLGALSGRVSNSMRRLVQSSLRQNTTNIEDEGKAAWQLLAGKIVIGTSLANSGFSALFPHLTRSKTAASPIEWLLTWVPDGNMRNEQLQLGQLLVERDLHAYRFYQRPNREASQRMLDAAVALDQAWKQSNAAVTKAPRELVEQSLKMTLSKRQEVLPYKGYRNDDTGAWFIVNGHKVDYTTLEYGKEATVEAGATHVAAEAIQRASHLDSQNQIKPPTPNSPVGQFPSHRRVILNSDEEPVASLQGCG